MRLQLLNLTIVFFTSGNHVSRNINFFKWYEENLSKYQSLLLQHWSVLIS